MAKRTGDFGLPSSSGGGGDFGQALGPAGHHMGVLDRFLNVVTLGEHENPGDLRAFGADTARSLDPRTRNGLVSWAGLLIPGGKGGVPRYSMSATDRAQMTRYLAASMDRPTGLESIGSVRNSALRAAQAKRPPFNPQNMGLNRPLSPAEAVALQQAIRAHLSNYPR